MGLKGVDLLDVSRVRHPRRDGLICTWGIAEAAPFRLGLPYRYYIDDAPLKEGIPQDKLPIASQSGGGRRVITVLWEPPACR